MNILLCSYAFAPSIGGIESSTLCFATALTERGHNVTVVTATSGKSVDKFPFKVVRSPKVLEHADLWKRADIIWHNNISLRLAWPLAIYRKPFVVTHQTWLDAKAGTGKILSTIKRQVCGRAKNVFISRALRDASGLEGEIVPNPYDDQVFKVFPGVARDRDIAFVGRLVPDKGGAVLIDAIAELATRGLAPKVTFVGAGPDLSRLKAQATHRGVATEIAFAGAVQGIELALLLNRHRVLAVPSLWEEPFGIVALEGAACGCFVIGTRGGGLPEAIGPTGYTIANGDAGFLADALCKILLDPKSILPNRQIVDKHLAKFRIAEIAQRYENILESLAAHG
jgi:glycogen synthase